MKHIEKWAIRRTPDNYEEINEWFNKTYGLNISDGKGYVHSRHLVKCGNWCLLNNYSEVGAHPDATIITIEQFRELTKALISNNKASEPLLFN